VIPIALAVIGWPLAGAYAVETAAEDDAQAGYSWDSEAAPLAFDTRIEGRRIPDYLRDLLEDARQLGAENAGGLPPPATLSQLRHRAEDDSDQLNQVLRSEAYYNGRVSASVRQAAGGDFNVVYVVALGPRHDDPQFQDRLRDYPAGGEALLGNRRGTRPRTRARGRRRERIID
jgi:hypothetical protein